MNTYRITGLLFIIFTFVYSPVKPQYYFPPLSGPNWDTVSPSSLGWCASEIDSVINFLGNKNSKAFIVLKDGKIAIEKYYGTFTKDSMWYWASAGKSLTAFIVGYAQQNGFLSIHDTSSKYLGQGWTSCSLTQENKITVLNQLTMTTGLDDGVIDDDCTLSSCLSYKADAGTRWAYHNAPYTLLDKVIESATGQTLNTYFINNIRNKTGMNGFYFKSGYNNIYLSTARSMARFGLLMLNKGKWNNTTILSDTTYYNAMINSSQNINPSYGYLWWLNGKNSFMLPGLQLSFNGPLCPAAPAEMFAAMGKNGQLINIVPSMGLVVIRMGNVPDNSLVPVTFNNELWEKLNNVFCTPNTITITEKNEETTIHLINNTIELNANVTTIEVLDMKGSLLLKGSNTNHLPVHTLPTGIYCVRLFDANKMQYRKIVVQH